MKSIFVTLAMSVTALSLASVACDHEEAPAADATTTTSGRAAAKPVSKDHIERIATTMCDREQACDNIGAGKKYATRDVCMMENRADNMNELTNQGCPFGIDQYAYDRCLTDIRGDKCDNIADHLSRLNACSKASLCPR